jgi:hypothetical protein
MKKPLYVKIGLFAIPTRKAAKNYLYFCLFVAILSGILGLIFDIRYFAGLIMLIAVFWYEVSIKWMDNNNAWKSEIK